MASCCMSAEIGSSFTRIKKKLIHFPSLRPAGLLDEFTCECSDGQDPADVPGEGRERMLIGSDFCAMRGEGESRRAASGLA
jgi:hypothetical protein